MATAVILRDSSWRSYRAGRAKVATQAAIYLNWLAPPADCALKTTLEVCGRQLFVFETGDGDRFADLLIPDASGIDSIDLDVVAEAFEQLGGAAGFAGVRLLFVSAPTASMLAVSPTRRVRLADTRWWFEAAS